MILIWEDGCPRTDNPCECGSECGWDSIVEKCASAAITTCDECADGCTCLTFDEFCPIEFNELLPCQCDDQCEIFEDCCDDYSSCPIGNHVVIY